MTTVDQAYEFDAPQYYNFRRTSVGNSQASGWFNGRDCSPVRNAFAEVTNQPQTVSKPATVQVDDAVTTVSAVKNIVTSWGAPKAVTGSNVKTTGKENVGAPPAHQQAHGTGNYANAAGKEPKRATQLQAKAAPTPKAARSAAAQTLGVAAVQAPVAHAAGVAQEPEAIKAPPGPPSPRVTRSVTKKRLEEAALQHANAKAKQSRAGKSLRAALSSARTPKPRAGALPPKRPATTARDKLATSKAAARAPAASTNKGPVKPVLKGSKVAPSRLAGAVTKPTASSRRAKIVPSTAAGRTAHPTAGPRAKTSSSQPPTTSAQRPTATRQTRSHGPVSAPVRGGGAAQRGASKAVATAPQVPGPKGGVSNGVRVGLRKALQPQPRVPVRSTKPLTMPEEPNLLTSARHVHQAASTGDMPAKSPFKPLVLKVKEFDKTPSRFKAKPDPRPPSKQGPAITLAKEPMLHTATRVRPSVFKPRNVEEEEEMRNMPKFHAQPLRPEVLAAPSQLVHNTERKPLTQPQPFHFISDDRAEQRRLKSATAGAGGAAGPSGAGGEGGDQFRALPLDPSILEAPVRVAKKARMSLTVPTSPLLLTKTRAHEVKWQEEKHEFKARPVPNFLHVPPEFHTVLEPPPLTLPQPFSLRTETRGQQHQQRLQARLAEEEAAAEAARKLKAQAPPHSLAVPVLPARPEPRPLTVPQPFTLQSEARHDEYVADFSEQLAAQEAQARADAQFKARDMWRGVPYQAQPSDAPLTAPMDPRLATEQRAAERGEFDRAVEEKLRVQEAEKALAAEAAARAEEEAVKEYRRSLRYKANPVPKFDKPFAAAPSNKPLTRPKTPKLGRKRKGGD